MSAVRLFLRPRFSYNPRNIFLPCRTVKSSFLAPAAATAAVVVDATVVIAREHYQSRLRVKLGNLFPHRLNLGSGIIITFGDSPKGTVWSFVPRIP